MDVDEAKDDGDVDGDGDEVEEDFILGKVLCFFVPHCCVCLECFIFLAGPYN